MLSQALRLKGNYWGGRRPPVKSFEGVAIAPFAGAAPAAVSISADFELNWAWRELSVAQRDLKGRTARRNFPLILELLEACRIPITWATVGHLFLQECRRGADGRPHPDMPRPPANRRWEGDWYRHDPCSQARSDSLWYAPDLIERILSGPVHHEIGTHSFSHIDFSRSTSSVELVRRELEQCRRVMQPYRLFPRSLIFPFNHMGYQHLDCLSECGVTVVRHRARLSRISYPERSRQGVYKIYETVSLRRPSLYRQIDKVRLMIEAAARRRGVCHFWFHPSDPAELFENEFRQALELMAAFRDQGRVWIATMSEIAAYCEARRQTTLDVKRERGQISLAVGGEYDVERYGSAQLTLQIPMPRPPKTACLQDAQGNCLSGWEPPVWRTGETLLQLPFQARFVRLGW